MAELYSCHSWHCTDGTSRKMPRMKPIDMTLVALPCGPKSKGVVILPFFRSCVRGVFSFDIA
jgi:hypothetical protein